MKIFWLSVWLGTILFSIYLALQTGYNYALLDAYLNSHPEIKEFEKLTQHYKDMKICIPPEIAKKYSTPEFIKVYQTYKKLFNKSGICATALIFLGILPVIAGWMFILIDYKFPTPLNK